MDFTRITRLNLLLFLLLTALPFTAKDKHAPLPPQILSAKTIYIENHGEAKIGDRAYEELQKWGRFKIVSSRESADIVLQLSDKPPQPSAGSVSTYDNKTGSWQYGTVNSVTPGITYMSLIDAKSGELLFSDTKKGANKRATGKMIDELQARIEEQEKGSKPN